VEDYLSADHQYGSAAGFTVSMFISGLSYANDKTLKGL
jgi:hypothetical protein